MWLLIRRPRPRIPCFYVELSIPSFQPQPATTTKGKSGVTNDEIEFSKPSLVSLPYITWSHLNQYCHMARKRPAIVAHYRLGSPKKIKTNQNKETGFDETSEQEFTREKTQRFRNVSHEWLRTK